MRIIYRIVVGIAASYVVMFLVVLWAMCQRPERFGRFMRYAPAPVVWGALPARDMWLWARRGDLRVGDVAPDFSLPLQGGETEVALSSFRGKQPVVLVFGSYT